MQGSIEGSPVVELSGVSKIFGGQVALGEVDFDVRAGEVHALVGMNGAGKSTLVGILSGALRPDAGSIRVDGVRLPGFDPRGARELGIATVPQRRSLASNLSVAENLAMGDLATRAGWVDWTAVRRAAEEALSAIGLDIDPGRLAGELSAAEQTMVEIAREVHRGGRVLILDEPTASLGGAAAAQVRGLVRRLCAQGRGVVYISHHLEEILELADRVTVLRDGRRQLTVPCADLDIDALVTAMSGSSIDAGRPDRTGIVGAVRLQLDGLVVAGLLDDFSLEVRGGEVVAVLGPVGDGQTGLYPALAGVARPAAGRLRVDGVEVPWGSIAASLRSGLRCITGERLARGLVASLGVDENVVMAKDRREHRTLITWRALRRRAGELRRRFGVVGLVHDVRLGQLSGGNQQKVLLAKWLESSPGICLLEDPTNGVDIAAKADIHRLIDELVDSGSAVLLASSDVTEVMRLADRVVVVSGGRAVAEREAAGTTSDDLVALTLGERAHA